MSIIEIPDSLMRGQRPAMEPTATNSVWFAGGAIRRWFTGEKQDSDVDVFGCDQAYLDDFVKTRGLSKKVDENKNAATYLKDGVKWQIIKVYSDTMEATIDKFDFQHCRFAWNGEKVIASVEAIACAIRKHLMVHNIQKGFELDSLRRAFRYQRQGFIPCLGAMSAIAASFREVTEQNLKDQTELSPKGGRRVARLD